MNKKDRETNRAVKKFRWFKTSDGVLVIAGKNAEQNEQVVKIAKPNQWLLHTKAAGSPFCLLLTKPKQKPSEQAIKEAAVFCAAFSKAFKQGKKQIEVHCFLKKNTKKESEKKKLPLGSFFVEKIEKKLNVKPRVVIVKDNNYYVVVPKKTAEIKKLKIIAEIKQGKHDKNKLISKIKERLKLNENQTRMLLALLPNKIDIIFKNEKTND